MKTFQDIRESYTSYIRHKQSIVLSEAKEAKKEKKYNENNLAIIQNIVAKNKPDKLKFKDESDMDCGPKQANSILSVHARLSKNNQKKLVNMLHQGKRHFIKAANFCQANSN